MSEEELKLMLRGAELSGAIEEEEQVYNHYNRYLPSLYVLMLLKNFLVKRDLGPSIASDEKDNGFSLHYVYT